MRLLLVVLFAVVGCALAACNECGFSQRCNGNILETCGAGPDQIVGRKISQFPCAAPNAACVELSESEAVCAVSPPTTCAEGAADTCSAGVITRCVKGTVVVEDCRRQEGTGRCDGSTGEKVLKCL